MALARPASMQARIISSRGHMCGWPCGLQLFMRTSLRRSLSQKPLLRTTAHVEVMLGQPPPCYKHYLHRCTSWIYLLLCRDGLIVHIISSVSGPHLGTCRMITSKFIPDFRHSKTRLLCFNSITHRVLPALPTITFTCASQSSNMAIMISRAKMSLKATIIMVARHDLVIHGLVHTFPSYIPYPNPSLSSPQRRRRKNKLPKIPC
jgi:hypothetical protein